LYTIANHVAANALRSSSRRPEVNLTARPNDSAGVSALDKMALAASGAMPARQLDKAELRDVVRAALAGLSERQRMAVLLNKFEGMSYADIATTMDMSPQAIKSLLSRARVNLKEILEPYLENGTRPQ
jgi:RNA polymerase sigma-70 factor (ECF subfamily)